MITPMEPHRTKLVVMTRRRLLATTAGLGAAAIAGVPALADPDDVVAAQRALFGEREIQEGRVELTLPPISENGFSVPISIEVDSPMTDEDHVTRIALFSPRNPLPNIATFHLGPRAGRARVETRIRLGGTQAVTAVAEMSDGSLWSGSRETVVTLAACVVL